MFYIHLQRFEPVGTCAIDLCDTLSIQLDNSYRDSPLYPNAVDIISYLKKIDIQMTLDLIKLSLELDKIARFDEKALELVRKLNPKPGLEVSKKVRFISNFT